MPSCSLGFQAIAKDCTASAAAAAAAINWKAHVPRFFVFSAGLALEDVEWRDQRS